MVPTDRATPGSEPLQSVGTIGTIFRESPMSAILAPASRLPQLAKSSVKSQQRWLWEGYVARRNITLMTSLWKAGKTTLMTGLMRALGSAGTLLGRPCAPAEVLVVSEEAEDHWLERTQLIHVGEHA